MEAIVTKRTVKEVQLTPTEANTLRTILSFGGYITSEFLSQWRTEIDPRNCRRLLQVLYEKKMLLQRSEYSVGKAPMLYQVTQKACAYIGRPNSFLRNRHTPVNVYRSLMRSYYLFKLLGSGFQMEHILCFSEDRVRYFCSLGIQEQVLPSKYNSGVRATRMDEHILVEQQSGKDSRVTILYFHKSKNNEWRQLHTLLEKYILLSQHPQCPQLHIRVLCEWEDERQAYERAAMTKMKQHNIKIEAATIGRVFYQP